MKRCLVIFIFVCLLSVTFSQFAYTQTIGPFETYAVEQERRGDNMLFDLLVLRPLGLVSCVIGVAGYIASSPFMATSGGIDDAALNEFIKKPAQFTFERQLGDTNFQH